jgi:hypothetical protein
VKNTRLVLALLATGLIAGLRVSRADAVTDWNAAFESTLQPVTERGPRVPNRPLAIMHVAMFDAVNGIERKYEPCHVADAAPPGARAEAAAIQAAYTALSALRPAHQSTWDAQLASSLAALAGQQGDSQSIARGRAWGVEVAQKIIAWRANDNSSAVLPTFVGETTAGFWRHAPLGAAPTAGYANLVTVPFVMPNQAMFDPGPPWGIANRTQALASALYAVDVNEVKARGGSTSTTRTAEDLDHALFNHASDLASFNRLLRSLVPAQDKLLENARRFALLNVTFFDTGIMLFRAKYTYALWRPFQAINHANEGANAAIIQDSAWTSFLPTPSHPEYPSAHVTIFSAVCEILARMVGDSREIELTAPPFAPRTYARLSDIADAAVDARVNLGFHFRDTGEVSRVMGRAIGDYIARNALQPVRK